MEVGNDARNLRCVTAILCSSFFRLKQKRLTLFSEEYQNSSTSFFNCLSVQCSRGTKCCTAADKVHDSLHKVGTNKRAEIHNLGDLLHCALTKAFVVKKFGRLLSTLTIFFFLVKEHFTFRYGRCSYFVIFFSLRLIAHSYRAYHQLSTKETIYFMEFISPRLTHRQIMLINSTLS